MSILKLMQILISKYNYLWFSFIIFSGSFYMFILANDYNYFFTVIIVILGLLLFSLKLKKKNLNIWYDINFKIIIYYLLFYLFYLSISFIISYFIFIQYKNGFLKDYNVYLSDEQFILHFRRWSITVSSLTISVGMTSETHAGNFLFSKKLGLIKDGIKLHSIVFISISLFWWIITKFFFIWMFIIIISLSTLPDFFETRLLKFSLKKLKLTETEYNNQLKLNKQQFLEKEFEYESNMKKLKIDNFKYWVFSKFIQIFGVFFLSMLYLLFWFFIGTVIDYFLTKYFIIPFILKK